jgi:DME family drug/metabolite transporter
VTGGRAAGLLALVLTSMLWGTTGTAATLAPGVGPLAIGAAALGVGGLLQAAVAVPALSAAREALAARRRVVALGGLAVAVYPLAFYSSMHLAGVAIGSVISLASAPLASGLLERAVDGRRLGPWWFLSAALGILGSALLCASSPGGAGEPGGTAAGVGLGLVAGACYALYSWATHRLMGSGVHRAASMGAVFGLGGLLLLPVLVLTGAPLLADARSLAVGAYVALVPMFLGYLLFGHGLARVPASTATTVTLTEPAIATLLAVVVVGERLGPLGWTGLGLIAAVLPVLALAPASTGAGESPGGPLPGGHRPATHAVEGGAAGSGRLRPERLSRASCAERGRPPGPSARPAPRR